MDTTGTGSRANVVTSFGLGTPWGDSQSSWIPNINHGPWVCENRVWARAYHDKFGASPDARSQARNMNRNHKSTGDDVPDSWRKALDMLNLESFIIYEYIYIYTTHETWWNVYILPMSWDVYCFMFGSPRCRSERPRTPGRRCSQGKPLWFVNGWILLQRLRSQERWNSIHHKMLVAYYLTC